MKRIINFKKPILILLIISLCLSYLISVQAETVYAGERDHVFSSRKECPSCDYSSIMTDEIQIKTAIALRAWYLSEYAHQNNWYDDIWNHSIVILTEPYIVKTESDEYSMTIYCSSAISYYGLFEDSDEDLYLTQGDSTEGLFRVSYYIYDQDDWVVTSVHRIENNEELYPGSGLGTDGFPGLSDNLASQIPEWGLSAYHIAQRYLEYNNIQAEIIEW